MLHQPSRRRLSTVLITVSFAYGALAQVSTQAGASRLRSLFFQRDYETGVLEGAKLTASSPNAADLKAWYVLNVARAGQEKQAVAFAGEMTARKPQDPWSWFALAGALNYQGERRVDAAAAAEKALKLLPDSPDVIWIRAQTLANDEKRRDEAIAFVDANRRRLKNPAEIVVTRGYALYSQSFGPPRDEAKLTAALAAFEEARQIDSTNLSAWYLAGSYLNDLRRSDEAYPLLKKALALSPGSAAVHRAYWRAVNGSRERSVQQKRQEIEADVNLFMQARGTQVGALSAVASISREMKWPDRQRTCEEKILKDFPDSIEAEWIFVNRWRALQDAAMESAGSVDSPEYRQMLRDFIARPHHQMDGLLGEAYRNLFSVLAADKSVSGDELYRVGEGALKYETNNPHITWVGMPITLADRKVHLADAERIAREGIEVVRKKVESQRSLYRSAGEYERSLAYMTGMAHDALGWVLLAEDRPADAEKELLAAYELNHEDRKNLDHLGRFYLARNDETKAEEYFAKGLTVQALGTNPCEASLRSLYEKRRGTTEGFDDYLAKLRDADRARRRDRVLGERLASPETVTAFGLKTLDGNRVSLESLKGKVVVINFWGIWCGWCVQELPDYQKLFEKYANDPDVAVLTIDNDANPDDVPPWMAQKKYTFPVLVDDGYVRKIGVQSFPTTWFLDPEGRKVFQKVGWSEKLLEEFSWRIEAIKAASLRK